MRKFESMSYLFIMILGLGTANPAWTQWSVDLEGGKAWARYNDVRVPKASGSPFSLTDDLDAESPLFFRIRIGYTTGSRHHLVLFAAPFTLKAQGLVKEDVWFNQEKFPAGVPLDASYTFNSYRATYRYDLIRRGNWTVGIGFTAKIRDAAIRLEGGGKATEKANVGFVPLLNFWVQWDAGARWSLVFEGDALASPGGQGRAEDVFLGGLYRISEHVTIKAGYRLLEGGADVEEVYNFAWINYLAIGTVLSF